VDLSVYDVQGRLMRRLVHGSQPPGRKLADWDGRDQAGQPVASGIYMIRLQIGSQRLRATLLRMR
jgi:flagellar hook assembly protein FlgD